MTWGETEAVFFLLVLFWKQFQGESGRKKVRAIFSEIQVMTIPLKLSSMNMPLFLDVFDGSVYICHTGEMMFKVRGSWFTSYSKSW